MLFPPAFVALALFYTVVKVVYRLYLSPLACIPGPKFAAATILYEFYYDVILGGQYTFKIMELHRRYGPIIRISPHELHVADPDFYSKLYATGASGERRDKYDWFTKSFGLDFSTFSSSKHDTHKTRRAALAKPFSQRNLDKLEGVIRERASALVERFEAAKGRGVIVNLSHAFAAFTNGKLLFSR